MYAFNDDATGINSSRIEEVGAGRAWSSRTRGRRAEAERAGETGRAAGVREAGRARGAD